MSSLPDNNAKMLVYKYVQYISYTHLNVNTRFVIKRVVTYLIISGIKEGTLPTELLNPHLEVSLGLNWEIY
jgi:hypothetical protein